jgi:hypothetical protein
MSLLKFNLAKFEEALAFQVVDINYDSVDIQYQLDDFNIIIDNNSRTKILLDQGGKNFIYLPKRSKNNNNTHILYLKSNDERDDIYKKILDSLSKFSDSVTLI